MLSILRQRIVFYATLLRSLFGGGLHKINLAVVEHCNSRCTTCDIWRREGQGEISIETFGHILSREEKNVFWLSLTGGEPFLHSNLASLVDLAMNRLPKLRILSVTTNGLLAQKTCQFVEYVLEKYPTLHLFLNISVDAIGEKHDRLRGVYGNFRKIQSLQDVLIGLRKRYAGRLKINLETTASSANQDELIAIRKETLKRKFGHLIVPFQLSAFYDHHPQRSKQTWKNTELSAKIKAYLKVERITNFQTLLSWVYLKGTLSFAANRHHPVPCTAGNKSVYIDTKGRVRPCIHWQYEMSEGELPDERSRARVESIVRREACPGCWTPCDAMTSLIHHPWRGIWFIRPRIKLLSGLSKQLGKWVGFPGHSPS